MSEVKEEKRGILSALEEKFLWAKAAGRCEFEGCNKIVYGDKFSIKDINLGQKAHIVANSPNGPRGNFSNSKKLSSDPSNFMLLCGDCHKRIDSNPESYSVEQLQEMKKNHEDRIRIVTSIDKNRKTKIVLFKARIGDSDPDINLENVYKAVLDNEYVLSDSYINLSISTRKRDNTEKYWALTDSELEDSFAKSIEVFSDKSGLDHYSIFALAPIPLLIKLGYLFSEIKKCEIFPIFRDREEFSFLEDGECLNFKLDERIRNKDLRKLVVKISVSGRILDKDVIDNLEFENYDIWEIRCDNPEYNIVKTKEQVEEFKNIARNLIDKAMSAYPSLEEVLFFPAIPNTIAVELGRVLPHKYGPSIKIYDRNKDGFIETIILKEGNNA